MNTLIDSLLSLHAKYPGAFTVLSSLIKATAVIAMAWALVLMLGRRSARARCWVWRIALLMLGLLAAWTARPEAWAESGLNVTIMVPAAPPSVSEAVMERPEVRSDKLPTTAELSLALKEPASFGWLTLARRADSQVLHVWALGFGLLLLWKLGRGVLGRWWLYRHSRVAGPEIHALCPTTLSCRISTRVTAPLITWGLRPVVWLPESAASWSELKLRAAFQHERAHYVRHDGWWQGVGTLAACAWWWLPLAWLALRQLKTEAEHAADDVTVTQSLAVPDYAEALVQIAGPHSLPDPTWQVGVAMSGYSELEKRVRELLRDNPWRDRLGLLVGGAMAFMLIAMSCVVLVGCKSRPTQFISLAKLVAGGRMVTTGTGQPQYQDYLQDLYGTIIETLEGSEMRRHAMDRVKALNPQLKEAAVEVHVTQNKGSAIFNIAAVGADPKFTRVFLDALLDEFRAFREQVREQQRNKALTALAEDVVKREASLKDKSVRLMDFKKINNIVVLSNGQNQSADFLKQITLEKNRLLLELSDMELALKDVDAAMASKRQPMSGQRAGSSDGDQRGSGLTRDELDYLNTRSELAVSIVDLETLRETNKPDSPKIQEAEQRKLRLEKLLSLYSRQVKEALVASKDNAQRRIEILEKKIVELSENAAEQGAALAEYGRLSKDYDESEKAYKEMFDLVHKFQVNEEMTGDYVTIMERASTAVMDARPWWQF